MAAVLVAPGAVLSHRSAAALRGLQGTERSRIEITVPRALKPRAGLRIHRAVLPGDETSVRAGIPVTTPARTLLDVAAILTPHRLERAASEGDIRRLGSRTSLAELVERHPGRPGTPAVRHLLRTRRIGRHVTKRELELRFLAFLDANGIDRPRTNAWVELEPEPKGGRLPLADAPTPARQLRAITATTGTPGAPRSASSRRSPRRR